VVHCGERSKNMNFIKKLVDLLKKFGFLKVGGSVRTYKIRKIKDISPLILWSNHVDNIS